MIGHRNDVPWTAHEHAGARSMPQHVQVDEEELFLVLARSGRSWQV